MDKKEYIGKFREMKEDGTAVVVFATMNVIDKDGDVTIPGAFGNQTVKVQPAHDWKVPNIGVATIKEIKNEAVAEIKFFLNTASGLEWYTSIKENFDAGVDQEYSYGFTIMQEDRREVEGRSARGLLKLKVHEVSPVLIGAGMDTRTLSIKSCKTCGDPRSVLNEETECATCKHKAAAEVPETPEAKMYGTMMGSWEAMQEQLRTAAYSMVFAEGEEGWVSLEGTFSNRVVVSVYQEGEEMRCYQFDWSRGADGNIALSNQTEVELMTIVQEKGIRLEDGFTRVVGEVKALDRRYKALLIQRQKEGRTLSRANRERLTSLLSAMQSATSEVEKFLAETDRREEPLREENMDEDGKSAELTEQMLAQFARTKAQLAGHISGGN